MNVVVGQEYDVEFRVLNDGDRAGRVIGAEYS